MQKFVRISIVYAPVIKESGFRYRVSAIEFAIAQSVFIRKKERSVISALGVRSDSTADI